MGVVVGGQEGGAENTTDASVVSPDIRVATAVFDRFTKPHSKELPQPGDFCRWYIRRITGEADFQPYVERFSIFRNVLLRLISDGAVLSMNGFILQTPATTSLNDFLGDNNIVVLNSERIIQLARDDNAFKGEIRKLNTGKNPLILIRQGMLNGLSFLFGQNPRGKGIPEVYYSNPKSADGMPTRYIGSYTQNFGHANARDLIGDLVKFCEAYFLAIQKADIDRWGKDPMFLKMPRSALMAILLDQAMLNKETEVVFKIGSRIDLRLLSTEDIFTGELS